MTVKALTGNDDFSQGYYSENETLHSVTKETVFFFQSQLSSACMSKGNKLALPA